MKIMWISGPAGSGKTAIAGSVAETCDGEGLLAATFFFSSFSGSEGRRLKQGLVTTLVYQLIQLEGMESLEQYVHSTIQRNPAIFEARLQKQMEILVLKPLRDRRASGGLPISAKVVIIDGLDEVEHPKSHQLERQEARLKSEAEQIEILCALRHTVNDPAFPFRILVVSRPERVIREFFSDSADSMDNKLCRKVALHDQFNADADIRLFLEAKFADIRRRYKLASSWPDDATLTRLVDTASGQFIYAGTVIRLLQDGKSPDPQAHLLQVLDWHSRRDGVDGLAPLDALYRRILQSSPDPCLATQWLRVIDDHPMGRKPALLVKQFLQVSAGQAEYLLENLVSLIDMPPRHLEGERPYKFYHKSFTDFLGSSWSDDICPRGQRSLMNRRLAHIFSHHPAATPLSGFEWNRFMDALFEILFRLCDLDSSFSAEDASCALPLCDATWWVGWVLAKDSVSSELKDLALADLFVIAHRKCVGRYAKDCTQACKHWRSVILRTCHSIGRKAPSAFDLLTLHLAGDFDVSRWVGDASLSSLFVIPAGRDRASPLPPLPPPRSAFRSLDDLQLQDPDYERMCETIDDLCARLPNGWVDQFRDDKGVVAFWGVRSKIEGVLETLGIHVDNVECWPEEVVCTSGSTVGGGARVRLEAR